MGYKNKFNRILLRYLFIDLTHSSFIFATEPKQKAPRSVRGALVKDPEPRS